MKKVLLFYSETGGGHIRGAQAIAEEMRTRKGFQVTLYDGLKKTNWGQKINPSLIFYIISNNLLPLYNLAYKLTDTKYGLIILRTIIKLIWGRNFKKILEEERPDLIVTTHHFISPSTTSDMDIKIPFVAVIVDLGKPHKIWFDSRLDYIIVPDQKMAKWAKDKFQIIDSKIKPLGYPIRQQFRKSEGFYLTNQILILGAGIKPNLVKNWIRQIKTSLPDKKIVVVCGHNLILQKALSDIKDVATFGFIDNLHVFLKKSDLVITKAGPTSILEAAALKKPVILVKWVGLQEKDNVDFVVEKNLGIYDPNGKNLTLTIDKIYKNYEKYTVGKNVISFDTEKIVNYLISLFTKRVLE